MDLMSHTSSDEYYIIHRTFNVYTCVCSYIFIVFVGGFAKVKAAIHKLTGEKVTKYVMYMIKINEPQLPWLQTAIISHRPRCKNGSHPMYMYMKLLLEELTL